MIKRNIKDGKMKKYECLEGRIILPVGRIFQIMCAGEEGHSVVKA